MKPFGIVGGLSPESTWGYGDTICVGFNKEKGGLENPEFTIQIVNLARVMEAQDRGDWERVGEIIVGAIHRLKAAGAEFAAIASNTPHNAFDYIQKNSPIPVLSIMDATAGEVVKSGKKRVALLGTKMTMEYGFFEETFRRRGIELIVPDESDRKKIHQIIVSELVKGEIRAESREELKKIIGKLEARGAEGVILGCTELPLILKPEDSRVPLFDTAEIHAKAILECATNPVAFRKLELDWNAAKGKRFKLMG